MISPGVSIVIPCYNAEKYLDMCMDSLLKQTQQDIEIICVDDGSTDSTLDKLNCYAQADTRVRIFSQQNQYAGAARNLGLSKARGQYILFLDADDFFEENMVQDAYSAAVSDDADVVIFDAQCFDDATGEIKKGWFLNTSLVPEKQPFCHEDCPEDFYQITTAVPWTKMFRRQFLLDTGLQFQTLRHTNDFFFVYSALAMAKRIRVLDKVLVNYRIGQKTNLQSTKSKSPFCFYDAYKALHDKLEELGLLGVLHRSYANQVLNGCLYNLRSMNDRISQEIVFEKLRDEIFHVLGIPDEDLSFFRIEANFYEMRLVRKGTFRQYLAFCASKSVRNLWYSLERGMARLDSCGRGTKAYTQALTSSIEGIIKALEQCDSEEYQESAYQLVHEAFNGHVFEGITLQSFRNVRVYQSFHIIQRHEYGTLQAMLKRRLIVSLTTYPARIDGLAQVLESLYNQERQADEIVLWLAEEEFPGKEQDLPEYLTGLVDQNRLVIRWCDNLKPHKKYFYAFREYPNDLIVTVDDDLLYSKNMLSSLHRSYLMYPEAVSAVRVHLMVVSEDNRILPYNAWVRETDCCLYTPSMQLFATGGAGTLYPPELFRKEFLDRDAIQENSPLADDLWLKAMELLSGVPVVAARPREALQYLPGSQEDALKLVNDEQKQNDVQLENIIRWTDRVFGKDSLVLALTEPTRFHSILEKEAVAHHLDRERRFWRQQFTEKEKALRQVESQKQETERQLKDAERKLKDAELKLKNTQRKLQLVEESKPIHRQMQDLGKELKGLREKGHSPLSVGFKLLVYKLAWIPEKMLGFLMYYLKNGCKQTIKHIFRK